MRSAAWGCLAGILCLCPGTRLPECEAGSAMFAIFAVHRKPAYTPSKFFPTLCDYGPGENGPFCGEFVAAGPAPGASTVFVIAVVSDRLLKGVTFGIDHEGRTGAGDGIDPAFSTWNPCVSGTETTWSGPWGDWPAPASALRIDFTECTAGPPTCNGTHVVLGAFYVYAYAEDVLRITPNRVVEPEQLTVVACDGTETNQIDAFPDWWAYTGRVHLGGDGNQGIPGCGACPEVHPVTWGRIKTLYH